MKPQHQRAKQIPRALIDFTRASKRRHRQQIITKKATQSSAALRTTSPTPDEISIWPITNLPAEVWQLVAICVTACISLLLMEFVANETVFAQFFPPHPGPIRFLLGSSLQSLVGGMGPDCLYRAADDRHASLTRQAPARLQSLLARLPPAFRRLRRPLCSGAASNLARIALARFLQFLSNVRPGRPFLVRPARVGRFIRGPIRRARIFLSRISGGRTFALHRNLRCSRFP